MPLSGERQPFQLPLPRLASNRAWNRQGLELPLRRKGMPMLTDTTVVKSSSGRTDINLGGDYIEYIIDKYYGVDRCSGIK